VEELVEVVLAELVDVEASVESEAGVLLGVLLLAEIRLVKLL
jgi:hypothetical protein